MKKVLAGAVLGLSILVSGGLVGHAEDIGTMHPEAEQPVESWTDSETGIRVDKYVAPTPPQGMMTTMSTSGWEPVGTDYWLLDGNLNSVHTDAMFHSSGGDYMFRIPAFSGKSSGYPAGFVGQIDLWEDDGTSSSDDIVTHWTFKPESESYDYIVRDIGNFVDGTNDLAEFYTRHQANFWNTGTADGRINDVTYYD